MSRLKWWLRKLYVLYLLRDQKQIPYFKFVEEDGEFLRLDYPLDENSIVFDVGGHTGNFTAALVEKFDCRIDVFEPVASYAEKIRERFNSNNKINVIQAGLGASEREELINIDGLGSTMFGDDERDIPKEKIEIISAVDYIKSKGCTAIDMITINIEGAEYELFNSLLDHPELISSIKYIQIQFHDIVQMLKKRGMIFRWNCLKHMKKMWDFPFVWESWERKQK